MKQIATALYKTRPSFVEETTTQTVIYQMKIFNHVEHPTAQIIKKVAHVI